MLHLVPLIQNETNSFEPNAPQKLTLQPHLAFLNESQFESCYVVDRVIGSGGFSTVYSAIRKLDNSQCAVKHVEKSKILNWSQEDDNNLPMEIKILMEACEVEGVNRLLEYFEKPDSFIFILQKPKNCQDLFDYITSKRCLEEEEARRIFKKVVEILVRLKEINIFHNDVKDENIIVDLDNHQLTIIDFGSSSFHLQGENENEEDERLFDKFDGTRVYSPPEWISFSRVGLNSACVWSLGVLLYNMLSGDVPFHTDHEILACSLSLPHHLSPECQQLIECCLTYERQLRPTLNEILGHPWLHH